MIFVYFLLILALLVSLISSEKGYKLGLVFWVLSLILAICFLFYNANSSVEINI